MTLKSMDEAREWSVTWRCSWRPWPSVITVDHEDLVPGQFVGLTGLTALVVPEREEVVGATFVQVGDVRALDVDSIGGDDDSGEVCVVDLVEQGLELRSPLVPAPISREAGVML